MICVDCTAVTYAGAPSCPHCGSTNLVEDIEMAKVGRVTGPTDADQPDYFQEGKSTLSPVVTETDVEKVDTPASPSGDAVVIGGELPGPGVTPTVTTPEAEPNLGEPVSESGTVNVPEPKDKADAKVNSKENTGKRR